MVTGFVGPVSVGLGIVIPGFVVPGTVGPSVLGPGCLGPGVLGPGIVGRGNLSPLYCGLWYCGPLYCGPLFCGHRYYGSIVPGSIGPWSLVVWACYTGPGTIKALEKCANHYYRLWQFWPWSKSQPALWLGLDCPVAWLATLMAWQGRCQAGWQELG